MIDEKAPVYSDLDWWRSAGNILGLELRGWTFRNEASFAERDTDRRVEMPGWLAERILQALTPGSTGETEGWRDIASAPKDGTEILLYGPGVLLSDGRTSMYARAQHVGWAHEVDGHFEWATRDPCVTCRPTHWRPLPEPPSAMLAAAGGRE